MRIDSKDTIFGVPILIDQPTLVQAYTEPLLKYRDTTECK